MKHIRLFLMAILSVAVAAGCSNDDDDNPAEPDSHTVAGQWHLASWGTLTDEEADIYISFGEDNTFDLYQRVYTLFYEHYEGTYSQNGNTLTGVYSDGTPWSGSYRVTFSSDYSRLTMTRTDDTADISVFERSAIPGDVTAGVSSLSRLSGAGRDSFRFL